MKRETFSIAGNEYVREGKKIIDRYIWKNIHTAYVYKYNIKSGGKKGGEKRVSLWTSESTDWGVKLLYEAEGQRVNGQIW